jgi:hypothetical protein
MATEDAYCDMWNRIEIIDSRTRSIFTVSLMISVGKVNLSWNGTFLLPFAMALPSKRSRESSFTPQPVSVPLRALLQ